MEKEKTSWDLSEKQGNAERLNVVNQIGKRGARFYQQADGMVGVQGKILYVQESNRVCMVCIDANLGFMDNPATEEEQKIEIGAPIWLRLDQITKIELIS